MKNLLLFIAVQLCTLCSYSQISPQSPWVWMKGDNTVDQFGVYGVQGIPHSYNKPGARNFSTTWRDAAGYLWLFGGSGNGSNSSGFLNDLWQYDPYSNKWTWMKGDSTTGKLGVYGSRQVTNSTSKPGGLFSSISWRDNDNNLWLFGGFGFGSNSFGFLNALWKYNPASSEWTWMKGDSTVDQPAIYGTKGVTSATSNPGARYGSQTWTDQDGNLWLFGGYGFDETTAGILNDVWKYDPATNNWTWINGDTLVEQTGVYGTKGIASPANKPGARYVCSSWKDESDNLWVFGGYGYDEANCGNLSELWKYDIASNQWTWINGDSLVDQTGHYGCIGVPGPLNKPGSRYVSSSWTDESGHLWLFGGYGYDSVSTGYLNDLWKYDPSTNLWTWVKGDNQVNQVAVYGVQCQPDTSNKSGGRTGSVSWTDGLGNLWLFGGYGYDGNNSGVLNDLWKVNSYQSILPLQLLQFTGVLNNGTAQLQWQTEQEISFSHFNIQRSFDGSHFTSLGNMPGNGSPGRSSYTWLDNDLRNQSWEKAAYRLQLVDKNGHSSYSRIVLFSKEEADANISIFPNPVTSSLNLSFDQQRAGKLQISIHNSGGGIVKNHETELGAGRISLSLDVSKLPAAAYFITVSNGERLLRQKFIKQ